MKTDGDCTPRGVVTILENQIDAEHKNEDRHGESRYLRNKQTYYSIIIALVAVVMIISGTSAFHWYVGYPLSGASKYSVQELDEKQRHLADQIAVLKSQNSWLRHSHNIFKAVMEDDKSRLGRGGAWEFAKANWKQNELDFVTNWFDQPAKIHDADGLKYALHNEELADKALIIEGLRRKLSQKNETHKAMLGFMSNRTNLLNGVTKKNKYRPNGFPFADWSPDITEKMVEKALRSFSCEAIAWVTSQDGWYTILNDELVERVKQFMEDYAVAERELGSAPLTN